MIGHPKNHDLVECLDLCRTADYPHLKADVHCLEMPAENQLLDHQIPYFPQKDVPTTNNTSLTSEYSLNGKFSKKLKWINSYSQTCVTVQKDLTIKHYKYRTYYTDTTVHNMVIKIQNDTIPYVLKTPFTVYVPQLHCQTHDFDNYTTQGNSTYIF